jgi:hypothetical protein
VVGDQPLAHLDLGHREHPECGTALDVEVAGVDAHRGGIGVVPAREDRFRVVVDVRDLFVQSDDGVAAVGVIAGVLGETLLDAVVVVETAAGEVDSSLGNVVIDLADRLVRFLGQ